MNPRIRSHDQNPIVPKQLAVCDTAGQPTRAQKVQQHSRTMGKSNIMWLHEFLIGERSAARRGLSDSLGAGPFAKIYRFTFRMTPSFTFQIAT